MKRRKRLCVCQIKAALRLYNPEKPHDYEVSDSSRGKTDRRFTIIAEYPAGKIVVKLARNSFTAPERVAGWAQLAAHYNNLGIYAPRFLRSINGEYGTAQGKYCIWAEEFAKYLPNETISYEASAQARLASLGRVAANPAPLAPWPSPYAMYDKFCAEDEVPELYENGLRLMREISAKFPEYAPRTATIMKKYERRRAAFEPLYRVLPKAVFQADMNKSNLLFDNSKFAGLMDFNLSGTDAVLSYALYECHYTMTEEELDGIKRGDLRVISMEERTRRNLAYVAQEYHFTDAERAAWGTFYNLAAPFWGYHFCAYKKWIRECGAQYIPQILDFIEFQMTRTDVGGWLP